MRAGERMVAQRLMMGVMSCGALLSALPPEVSAQELSMQDTTASIEEIYAAAQLAEREARWQDALKLYERAYLIDEDGYYIYRRAMIYEQKGEDALALELLKEQREVIASSARVTDLPLAMDRLEQRVRSSAGTPVEPPARRPVGAWVVTGVGATALMAGGATWALGRRDALNLLCASSSASAGDARCQDRERGGRYDEPEWDDAWRGASLKQSAGVVSMSLGGAMLVGGVMWLLLGKQAPDERAVYVLPVWRASEAGGAVHITF